MTKRTNSRCWAGGAPAAGARAWTGLSALWCAQLGELATQCAGSFAEEEAERVRMLFDLLQTPPEPDLILGLDLPPCEQFERLLAAGACDAAALAMVSPATGYLLSRGATGLHAASVYLPDAIEDVTAIGDSAALALAGAIAQALVDRQAGRELASLHLN